MKLRIVGSGAISGIERSACSIVDNKILIDCGNGLLKTLGEQQIDIMKIEVIMITHLHADHFFDLPFFALLRFTAKPSKEVKIYCPVGTEKIIEHLCDDYVSGKVGSYKKWKVEGKLKFIEFDSLTNEEILSGYFVSSYTVCHGEKKPAYGYTITNGNKCVGFSGDTSYCDSVEKIVKNSDVAVLDMCSLGTKETHMYVDDIEKICYDFKDKIIIGTHNTASSREDAMNRKINNLIVAFDGFEMDI